MPNETTEAKLEKAAEDISVCIAEVLLAMAPRLAKRFEITDQQLAVAFVGASMRLLAGTAAGLCLGPDAPEAQQRDTVESLLNRIRPVVKAAIPDKGE